MEVGRIELDPAPLSLKRLIDDIVLLFRNKAEEKGLQLIVKIPVDFPKSIIVDEVRIRQILVNIFGNAIKFTSRGYIKTTVCVKENHPEKNLFDISISVEDTGIGIREEDRQIVFEPFTQSNDTAVKIIGGTGLGLAISNRLANLLGGNIRVESTLGKGSKFVFDLKNIQYSEAGETVQNNVENETDNVLFDKKTILVIDDIIDNIDVLKGFLSDQPFTIMQGYNGIEAITLANKHHPDIIFMDIRMPEMDGFQATELLKKDLSTSSIPIVAFTASVPNIKDNKELQLFNDVLLKPVSKNNLFLLLMKYFPYKRSVKQNEIISIANTDEISLLTEPEKSLLKKNLDDMESAFSNIILEISEVIDLNEVDNFVEKLEKFIKNKKIPCFEDYLERLKNGKNSFDIEVLLKTIAQFNNTIKNIRTKIEA